MTDQERQAKALQRQIEQMERESLASLEQGLQSFEREQKQKSEEAYVYTEEDMKNLKKQGIFKRKKRKP